MRTPVLAQRDPADMISNPEFLWLVGALIATLLVGAFVLSWVERWRKRQLTGAPANELEQISNYRQMFERGELSKEEYDRIKAKEALRMRDKIAGKPAAPSPSAPAAKPVQPSAQEPTPPAPPA